MTQAANYTITASSELMENYQASEILTSDKQFAALQTTDGDSLLFSIGTGGALHVIREAPGEKSGWSRADISTECTTRDFPAGSATCTTFAVSQRRDGTIGVAMVVSGPDRDLLYLSLNNSASDIAWIRSPKFTAYAFDGARPPSSVRIVGVHISEISSGEYILVDVLRDPESSAGLIDRYWIDPDKTRGTAWNPCTLTVDLEKGGYTTCLGRRSNQQVGGFYTSGKVTSFSQIIYLPVYNAFDPEVPPSPSRLELPGGRVADTIAACRNADDTTDLFAVAAGALYRFSSTNQGDGATAQRMLEHPLFVGVRRLFAEIQGGQVVIWGLNGSNEVFYVSSPVAELDGGGRWSAPVPILSQAAQVSPYLNRKTGANTFFAHTGTGRLTKMVKSPQRGFWRPQLITLPPPSDDTPARKFKSYTTRLQVTNDADQPVKDAELSLRADDVTTVFINHLYYVLGPSPIKVKTDALGSVTIVEPVSALRGTRLAVRIDGGSELRINPMEKAFVRATSLDTVEKLSAAEITAPDGSTRPLVDTKGAEEGHLKVVAETNKRLAKVYADLESKGPSQEGPGSQGGAESEVAFSVIDGDEVSFGIGEVVRGVSVDLGDLVAFVENGVQCLVEIVKDAASEAWSFIVKIGDAIYSAVLDVADKVVAAVAWIYSRIKVALGDLFDFLKYVFEWNDITRTKQVIKNLVKVYLQHQAAQLPAAKAMIDDKIREAIAAIKEWGGIQWSALGVDGNAALGANAKRSKELSAPGSMLLSHMDDKLDRIKPQGAVAELAPAVGLVDALLEALEKEKETLGKTVDSFKQLSDRLSTLSLVDALKALVAILSGTVLEATQRVLDAVLDVLHSIAVTALNALDTQIRVPVVSDILEGFGVQSLSLLDLFAWIAAVPVTIAYKVVHGAAPFADNEDTKLLCNATSFEAILRASSLVDSAVEEAEVSFAVGVGPLSLSKQTAKTVFTIGKGVAFFCGLLSAIFDSFEAATEVGLPNPASLPSTICAIVGGTAEVVADTLVPHAPLRRPVMVALNRFTGALRLVFKITFSNVGQGMIRGGGRLSFLEFDDNRAVGAAFDAILVIPASLCTICHVLELCEAERSHARTLAILEETSNVTGYIARVTYLFAVTDKEPNSKAVAIGVMAGAEVIGAGLQMAQLVMGPA